MSVDTTTRKQIFPMDGSTVDFTFTFRALVGSPTDIKCTIKHTTTLVETELDYTTDYTASINSTGLGGTVTVTDAQSSDYTLTVYRETTKTQETTYRDYNAFPAATLTDALDKLTMITQEASADLERALKTTITATGSSLTFPALSTSKYLTNDGSTLSWGTISSTLYSGSIQSGANADKAASPSAGDIYISTDTDKLYICLDAGTWVEYMTTSEAHTITGVFTFTTAPVLPANTIDAITEIKSTLKSGQDATLITGTKGTTNHIPKWNGDGDLIEGYALIDDDTMATASATNIPSAESVKAYADSLIKTGEYTGNGATSRTVSGLGFQPKYITIYSQVDAKDIGIKTDQDGTKTFTINSTGVTHYTEDQIISLDSDGFTVGDGTPTANYLNVNSAVYTYIAFR